MNIHSESDIKPQQSIRVVQLVTSLARGGAQATVIASASVDDPTVEMSVLAGPQVTAEGSWWGHEDLDDVHVEVVPDLVRAFSPTRDFLALLWLIRFLFRERPDVLHTHSSKAGVLGRLAAWIAGIPVVHTVHGWGPLHSDVALVRWGVRNLERFLSRRTDKLVFVGRADIELAEAHNIGTTFDHRLIRSGIELGEAESLPELRCKARADLGVADRFVVGMVGRLADPKDHRSLLEAFWLAAIPNSTLIVVGDGPDRSKLEAMAEDFCQRDSSVDIRFLGLREDAAVLVAGFDIAVHSSRFEGLPRTVVEAAASAVAVVSMDVGSVADVIEDGVSGRLVAIGDPASLSGTLDELAHNDELRCRMATAARRRSYPYAVDRMRTELVDLWWEVSCHSLADRTEAVAEENLEGSVQAASTRLVPSALAAARRRATSRPAGGKAARGNASQIERRNPGGGGRPRMSVRRESVLSAASRSTAAGRERPVKSRSAGPGEG